MTDPVSCPDAAQLKHLLEGTLPEGEQSVLHEHLETCAPCQQTLQSLAAGSAAWSGAARHLKEEEEAKPAALQRAVAELEAETGATQTRGQPGPGTDLPLDFLSPSDKPGHLGKLGHYEVQEVIGRGGMGIVLKAFDETLHRVVAIKVMAPEWAGSGTPRKRFVREAQAAAAVRNDHVIDIYAVEEAYQLPYLVMEYISGKSLQERLDESGPLQLKEILRIGMQTANGLAAAHAQGLVHRDIKPANILMENGVERVKITDFGLARAVDDASISQSGVVAGTPQFMAPEQARGEHLDHRADLFSLGSTLYAMCTGRAPFRAHNTVAVLRRVSDDQTRPIREINAEIPDWLVAIVDKLHAKEPADRYQTAAEVAELLGQHLAQLQQPVPRVAGAEALRSPGKAPSRVAAPAGASKTQPRPPTGVALLASKQWHTGRWVAAAAVLLVVVGALSVTEATGVTKITDFVATTLRITTPEGTLIVEVDDPNVKVTIEGDGGLVITGAGPQEVRLKPGSYKVEASKDGKPVKSEVVTITRNGKKVVTVQIEGPPAGVAGRTEKQAFVVLGGKAVAERKFDTLAEAVAGASDGDTIEIRGNGPFVTKPIVIDQRSLTIRAGEGFWPLIKADPEEQGDHLLNSQGLLVLQGLDFQWVNAKPGPLPPRGLVSSYGPAARLYAVNCRFLMNRREGAHNMRCIGAYDSPLCHLRNCQLLVGGYGTLYPAFHVRGGPNSSLIVDNCLVGQAPLIELSHADPMTVVLNHNTFFGGRVLNLWNKIDLTGRPQRSPSLEIVTSANIFDGLMTFVQLQEFLKSEIEFTGKEGEKALKQLVGWRDHGNLYSSPDGSELLTMWLEKKPTDRPRLRPTAPITTLSAWKDFWGIEKLDSMQGLANFQGGNLIAKSKLTPELLTPEDFRLRPDSAGYRAGKDGKDLGADVDLVGPGAAYERWKKTPEYQQWLKDTGQLRAEAPKPEPKAFVVRGGKGVAERKFDTLAEAVLGANDGDTIEIRGNGPFVTQPIDIRQALAIRAGTGFRPVIKADPEEEGIHLLQSNAALVLEGLDLQWVDAKAFDLTDGRTCCLVAALGPTSRLYAANCRFLMNRQTGPHRGMICMGGWDLALCQVRNCQFLLGGHGTVYGCNLNFDGIRHGKVIVDNSLIIGHGVSLSLTHVEPWTAVLSRNTFLGSTSLALLLRKKIDPPLGEKDPRPLQVETSANILGGPVNFHQWPDFLAKERALSAEEAEQLLPKLVSWRELRNIYTLPDDSALLILLASITPGRSTFLPPTVPIRTLTDWKQFWGMADIDSERGQAKFQGGDLLAKAGLTPHLLTPEDFRLRPDSPGYRAGKDGKDLGADVDLVGPGAAYERWKKTPEYQQWLKDTGQKK